MYLNLMFKCKYFMSLVCFLAFLNLCWHYNVKTCDLDAFFIFSESTGTIFQIHGYPENHGYPRVLAHMEPFGLILLFECKYFMSLVCFLAFLNLCWDDKVKIRDLDAFFHIF